MMAWSEDSNLETSHELVLFHKSLLTVPSLLSQIGSKSSKKELPRKAFVCVCVWGGIVSCLLNQVITFNITNRIMLKNLDV